MPYYPGDVVFRASPICTFERSGCNMHELHLGTHTGSHVDVPFHFLKDGKTVDQIPLYRFIEMVQVVEVKKSRISVEDLSLLEEGVKGVLFKTKNSDYMEMEAFYKDYAYLTLEAAEWLIDRKIRLIGIDYVSIEEFGTPSFQVHKKLLEAEILLFEGLNLKDVPPGKYVFIGLPLRLKGMDGSPVRALLIEF
jgi:arylformamidase